MKKQVILDIPKGMDVVYDSENQTLKFIPLEWKLIKTFDDVLNYFEIDKKNFEKANKEFPINKWELIMKAFLKASNDQLALTRGTVYYPYCYIVWSDKASEYEISHKVRDCRINGRDAFLVGGYAYSGGYPGFGFSSSLTSAAYSDSNYGFRAVDSIEVAKHISKYFAKELIDFTIGWRTNEIEWL